MLTSGWLEQTNSEDSWAQPQRWCLKCNHGNSRHTFIQSCNQTITTRMGTDYTGLGHSPDETSSRVPSLPRLLANWLQSQDFPRSTQVCCALDQHTEFRKALGGWVPEIKEIKPRSCWTAWQACPNSCPITAKHSAVGLYSCFGDRDGWSLEFSGQPV